MIDKSKVIWRNYLSDVSENNFADLYDYYADKLYSYGIHLGFDSESCKDAIQDVFINIHSNTSRLKNVDNPASFLFKSFRNRLIDMFRSNKNDVDIDNLEDNFHIKVTVLDNIIDKEKAELLKQKVENMLSKQSSTQREAVYMRYIAGLEYKEISDLLNIKPESARKLMHRAMEKLREQNIDDFTKAALIIAILLKNF